MSSGFTNPLTNTTLGLSNNSNLGSLVEIQDINNSTLNQVNYPIRFVGDAHAFNLWEQCTDQAVGIGVTFYTDIAGTNQIDSYSILALVNDIVRTPVPVLGPYMSVSVLPQSPGNPCHFTLILTRTPQMSQYPGLPPFNTLNTGGVAIGANTTVNLDDNHVTEGPATWSGFMGGGNYAFVLRAVFGGAANFYELDRFDSSTATPWASRNVWLPPMHIRAIVQNNNAAPQTYFLNLTRKYN